ncbi:hypothetical protein EJ110_NYTH20753 [Nymphaea thermarum]|nr:hypothetical protein EJ110_NYTH20753 [Nymphaea thermarum]
MIVENSFKEGSREKKRPLKSKEVSKFRKKSSGPALPVEAVGEITDIILQDEVSINRGNDLIGEEPVTINVQEGTVEPKAEPLLHARATDGDKGTRQWKSNISMGVAGRKLSEDGVLKVNLRLPNYLVVSNVHVTSPWARVLMFWNPQSLDALEWKICNHRICARLQEKGSSRAFGAAHVYFDPDFRMRRHLFDELSMDLGRSICPFIFMGDFNLVCSSQEKTRRPLALRPCLLFSIFMSQNDLMEISNPSCKFTWNNDREGQENIMCKLDHCFLSAVWRDNNQWLRSLTILPRSSSDYNPLLFEERRNHSFTTGSGKLGQGKSKGPVLGVVEVHGSSSGSGRSNFSSG